MKRSIIMELWRYMMLKAVMPWRATMIRRILIALVIVLMGTAGMSQAVMSGWSLQGSEPTPYGHDDHYEYVGICPKCGADLGHTYTKQVFDKRNQQHSCPLAAGSGIPKGDWSRIRCLRAPCFPSPQYSCQVQGKAQGDIAIWGKDQFGIYIPIQLGKGALGKFVGQLWIGTNVPGPDLAKPESLQLMILSDDVEEIRDNADTNALRQVMAPEGLADITVSDPFKYSVKMYHPEDVETELDSNGYYVVKAGAVPFSASTVENPAASTNDYNTFRVTSVSGGDTNVNEYSWSQASNGLATWALSAGAGLKIKDVIRETDDTFVRVVKNGSQVEASRVRETWRAIEGEDRTNSVITEKVVDPDGAALTTTSAYFENSAQTGKFGQIQCRIKPNGSWKRYDYDEKGRKTGIISSWQNAATNAADDDARQKTYSYVPVSTQDTGKINEFKARTVTKTILGTVVRKKHRAYYYDADGDQVYIREKCAFPDAAYGDTNNLRTVKIVYRSGIGTGRLKSREYPDGRKDTYTYEQGVYTTNADPAQCAFEANATGEYMRVTCVHGTIDNPEGIANKTTKDVTIENAVRTAVMQETYVYTGSGAYSRIGWAVYCLDDMGRPTDVWKSNGTHAEATWGCCGKEWEKDENGVETSYTYDSLKRLTQKIKHGIAQGTYPAQADIYTTYTYDAAGRKLTGTVSAGGLSQTASNQYDLAGRLVKRTDISGLVTEISYADGGLTTTETLPGGYTRITERYKDGQVKSITGTGQMAQYYEYGVNENGTKWAKVYAASNNSPVWVKTTTNLLGRIAKVEKPGYSGTETTEYVYNNKGQMVKTTTTGEPDMLNAYDEIGNRIQSGLDIDGNGVLDLAGNDRIAESETSYVQYDDQWWQQTVNRVYAIDNSAMAITSSVSRKRLTGFSGNLVAETITIDANGNQTISQTTVDRSSKLLTRTIDVPNSSSNIVLVLVNGLLVSSQRSMLSAPTLYTYDALGRRTGQTDPRTNTITTHYDSHGWVDYVEDAAGNRTTYAYDSATGRKISQTGPLSNTMYYAYTAYGQLEKIWGSAAYPVSYEYDVYGRMTKINTYRGGTGWTGSTWPTSPGTADTTEWVYHEASGLLIAKKDAVGQQISYTHSPGGKLASRTWARLNGTNSLVTTYSYSTTSGDLTGIDYSDSTPDVSFTYDRLGRHLTAVSSVASHTFTYSGLLPDTETIVRDGVTNVIDRSYDGYSRPTGFNLNSDYQVAYGYDTMGRLNQISNFQSQVSYSYLPNSDRLSGYSDSASGLQVSRSYEQNRNLLTQVKNMVGSETISQYDYANDNGGRRTSIKHSGNAFEIGAAFNLYGYNSRNEVTTGDRYWGANLNDTSDPVGGQSFGYSYDNIGNRLASTKNEEQGTYSANALNQYSQRTIPDVANLLGSASTNATVTVNSLPASRHGAYWQKALQVTNDSTAAYPPVEVIGVSTSGTNVYYAVETGHVFVAKTPEAFAYDDDGNLLSDGRFNYAWDCENRLIGAETLTNLPSSVPRVKLEFAYDYMSRRVSKTVNTWNSSSNQYQGSSINQFVYNGWNLIREITSTPTPPYSVTNSYVWGLDLSGYLQGAGGIGGLLAARLGTNNVCYTFDGNGNVSELIANNGSVAAHYEYSPFGETIVAAGLLAKENEFRFSTKFTDDDTSLLYYGYRYYSPSLGRWLARDPVMDPGSVPAMMIKDKLIKGVNNRIFNINQKLRESNLTIEQRRALQLRLITYRWIHDAAVNGNPRLFMQFTGNNFYRFCANDAVSSGDLLGLGFWDDLWGGVVDILNWVADWMPSFPTLIPGLEGATFNETKETIKKCKSANQSRDEVLSEIDAAQNQINKNDEANRQRQQDEAPQYQSPDSNPNSGLPPLPPGP